MNDIDVLIVGGGISGLSVAWWLAQADISVEVWEQDTRLGGKIQSVRADGYLTEQAASMVLNFLPTVSQFMRESGFEAHKTLRADIANRYLVHEGRLLSLPMKLVPMIMSPLWSRRGKLRFLIEPFIPRRRDAQETVSEFITRRLGTEVLEKALGPFVTGTLASDPDKANAYSVLPRLTALERRYGSLTLGVFIHKVLRRRTAAITEAFSFQGGMSTLVELLAKTPGVHFRPGYTVIGLEKEKQGWRVTGKTPQGEQTIFARQVVLSTPANVAASLLEPLDSQLTKYLRGIETAPLSVVHLGISRSAIRHSLDGTGFLTPRKEGLPVTGCLWMSSLFPDRAPQGKVLLSAYLGGALQPAAVDWDDDRSVTAVMATLQRLLGIKGDPENVRIDRHFQGLPLYYGNYTGRLAEIDRHLKQLPGLHLDANYRGGVSVRDRIASACTTAERILSRA
ncbi:MAG: protoporphyrinogen oxidase [Candidatus Parabeggiatoa sp. nov. 3]|nr:MAG: protoporphyrinogen oxidase [Gammaproteobacteria bacterium]RKZ66559.1 MAG: protoporphyrinogen oxidase [Gammaproteobacteria bacterium]RKZ81208.1 MAG: protoporphyrinogen oxidase [Gammaproteobacteria bacterium]